VAIRCTLDWTVDAKWAAASALNCENKYAESGEGGGLRRAGQAQSPIVICLGVHTGWECLPWTSATACGS